MADDSEWLKLPTDEKCQHKIWKARVAGYEEATKLFNSQDDEKSPEFAKFQGLIKKFVVDSNAVAQEKALEAVLAYVENAHLAGRICSEVIYGVVTKCLNASKSRTKELGNEIIMMYIEIDKPDVVQEELLKGVDNKQPKIVVGCIMALTRALREYGSKVIQVKPIVKVLAKLLDDRDKMVREETKQLVIEIYRWVGAAIKPQFSNFKPIQVQEFEAEFEKLPDVKPVQSRFMRSQQDLKAKIESQMVSASSGDGGGVGGECQVEEEVDPYDLIEPVNILALLPKDYYEKIEAKKWQERKEALDALLKLSENPKLEPGDYNSLIKSLVKIIGKDTNVMLVALGGKILAGIANGLRKEFKPYANMCFGVILDKFKEKKLTVVVTLREAIDAVFFSINYESVLEEIVAALENKNPSIRAETAGFLARSFSKATPSVLPKKILKVYCIPLVKTINDPVPEVREKSFEALGTAMQLVGEKNIMPFIADVDNIKQQKIKECCEKAVLLLPNGQPRPNQKAAAATAAVPAQAKSNAPKPVSRPTERTKAPADRPQTAPASSKSASKKKAAPSKGKGNDKEEPIEPVLADEIVEENVSAHLSAEVLAQLTSSNWKERLEAMDKFLTIIKGLTKEEIPTQAFVRTICKKPGLKDNNFQVLNLKFELLSQLAQKGIFSKCSAGFCLEIMVEKIGDIKTGASCREALLDIAEATSLDFVSQEVINAVFSQKNPKNQTEALNWLAQAIKEFGFKVNFKPVNEKVKVALAATNPAIRTAAIHLLGVVYIYMGPTLRVFYENEKSALLQQIDAEFEKVKGEKPQAPTRGLSGSNKDGEEAEGSEENDNESESASPEDLIPRTDIGDLITGDILQEMADKNWKIRNEGLQKVIGILNENKFLTPNLGQLPDALKLRLGDTNKNMVITTLGILQTLATALGPHCKQHIRTVGPGIINCLGDSKVQLRTAALATLNAWVEKCSLHPLVESEAIFDALKVENPNLRAEFLGWLSEKLPQMKSLPSELKLCIPLLLNCLEDRNGDVRKKAHEALVPFMIHVGYECFFKNATKAKPASKDQLMQILEKARANLPAKPAKPVKAATQSQSKISHPPAPVKKVEVYDDSDDVDMPLPAARPQTAPVEGKAKAGKPAKAGRGKVASKTGKKKDDEDLSPPLFVTVTKESRLKDEKNLKVLKWNFTEPRMEFVEQLRGQMEKNMSKTLMEQLFHSDFKSHIKAIESLTKCLDAQRQESIANLDLILKWITLRFFDTNPSMLNKALEYLQCIFVVLAEEDYHMTDIEAISFLPYLINKVGDPKDNVRQNVRTILKSVCKVYPGSKLFTYIIDGLKSKNSKQRMECLEECACLIEVYGISVCQPSPAHAMKLIAQQISDRDNGVRNAALNTMVTAYMILNDKLFNLTGTLCDKDQSLFDERLKRHMKTQQLSRPKIIKEDKVPKILPNSQKIAQPINSMIRPGTAGGMPRSSSKSPSRGTYQLDIEDDVNTQVEMPKLFQLDLDEIYEPVTLPKTRKSPTVKVLGNSGDMSSHVNSVINQITNSRDIDLSIQALCQLDEVLRDPEKSEIFANSIDQLLLAVSLQIKISCSTHMSSEDVSKDDLTRLYKSLLATMMTVFSNKSLGTQASRDVLKDLTNSVITLLLDSRLMDLGEGPQVVRTVNTMVIRIIENSNFTNMLSASIRLLHDSVSSENCTPKFIEMIMKCMWRMVRMLPDSKDLNVDKILYDTHLFLKAFPTSSWKEKNSDLPLRTIKTILHTLTKMKGNKILSHLTLIDSVENSELEAYLVKTLKSGVGPGQDGHMNREEIKHKRLSKNSHDLLAEIFKKIGSKENTVQGLNELYDFKEKNPDADLAPYLKKSSEFFQSYIENGMRTIAQERRRVIKKASSSHQSNIPNSHSAPTEELGPNFYRERLRQLRMICGLDKTEEGEKVDAPKLSDASNTINQPIEESEQVDFDDLPEFNPQVLQSDVRPASVVADVSELKMRLDRIKKNLNKS